MNKMNPVVKQMWIDALRSGDYKQGTGFLRTNNRYCCLGVLCDLAIKTSGIGKWDDERKGWIDHQNEVAKISVLPPEIMAWAGLEDRSPTTRLGCGRSLSSLNDKGYTFEQIADVIEREL